MFDTFLDFEFSLSVTKAVIKKCIYIYRTECEGLLDLPVAEKQDKAFILTDLFTQ